MTSSLQHNGAMHAQHEEKQKTAADAASASSASPSPPPVSSPGSTVATLPTFSPALQSALQEVLPSTDPLDSPLFDPIAFINSSFPDEQSLSGNKLDVFLSSLRKQVKQYNDVITRDVREHSCSRSVTRDAIEHATTSITQLFNKIRAIKEKAAESELMVQEICRDIRSLDHAKKHLTSTIIALRNLHMLVSAVGQLDLMLAEKQYRDAARLVKAIDDLFSLFAQYKHIEKIRQLDLSVSKTKELMKEQLQHDFHRLLPSLQPKPKQKPSASYDEDAAPPPPDEDEQAHTRQLLADGCLLVDVLDSAFKQSIFLWFSSLLLEDYVALYSYGKEGATIEQIDRRYMWCRRMIRNYDDTYLSVFPSDWEMPAYVASAFCKLSKAHIVKMLSSNPKFDVAVMLKSLTNTIAFERELTYNIKMRRAPEDRGVDLSVRDSKEFDEMEQQDLVESIKMKYRAKTGAGLDSGNARLDMDRGFNRDGDSKSSSAGARKPLPPIDYHGAISDAFTPYMSSYVELERKKVTELMDKVEREERWSHPEESKARDRYGGSDDLFLYIKNSIKQCNNLNRNEIFYQLYLEYRRGLTLYADMLERHSVKKDSLNERETVMLCYIVNTGEYCAETVPALEQSIKASIDTAYKEKIDMAGQVEAFSVLISKAVQLLVGSVFTSLNRVLTSMQRTNWESWTAVGDESGFVTDMQKILKHELPIIARNLSARYLPFYCNQLASTFIPKYVDAIYKCKRIGEMGAQQMSLDAHSLKATMLQLPTLGDEAEEDANGQPIPRQRKKTVATKSYTKYVTTEMSKAEALLKTLVSPNERLIVTFKALLPKSSTDDLLRVFALKGLKKQEIGLLVDAYNATVGADDQLKLVASAGSGSLSAGSSPAGAATGKAANLKSFLSGLGQSFE